MVKIVECDTVGESLTGWAEAADQPAKDALCEALDCSGGGGGGDLCEQIEALDVATGFGETPQLLVYGADGCKRVSIDTSGVFTDIRAFVSASPAQILVGGSTSIKFSARNVSSVDVADVQLVATLPALTASDPEYSLAAAVVSSGAATATPVDESTHIKVWNFSAIPAGAEVSVTYVLTSLKEGPVTASTLVDIQDDSVVDFDDQDDYHAIVITSRVSEAPPTPECPAMNIMVAGERTPMIQATSDGRVSLVLSTYRAAGAMSVGLTSSVTFTSSVPITVVTDASTQSTGGKFFYDATNLVGHVVVPSIGSTETVQNFTTSPNINITGDGTTFTLANTGAKARYVVVAARPNEQCRWQSFMVFVPGTETWDKGSIAVTAGTAPPLDNIDVMPTNVEVANSPQGATYHSAGTKGDGSVVPRAHMTFNIPAGGGPYTFTVTSTDQPLGINWNSTGVVDLSVPNSTTAEITINPGTPANNLTIGDFTFNFA